MIWTTATINRFAEEAEKEIARQVKCIVKRVALDVRAYVSLYAIPDDVLSIRRVTWQGKKLEPRAFSGYLKYPVTFGTGGFSTGAFDITAFDDGFYVSSASQTATPCGPPYVYFYSGFGENVIKLFPTPNVTLAPNTTDLFGSSIPLCCIVEYWAFPDVSGTDYRIPTYIARRLIKSFVLWKCFSQEGPGQDLIAAQRHEIRFKTLLEDFRLIVSGVFVSRVRVRTPAANTFPTRIGRPRLPSNFGTYVDE